MNAPPGQRLVPVLIDEQAERTPTKVYASVPQSSQLEPGCYRDVTIRDFARAIDRLCAFLEPLIGFSTTLNTVAYFGPPDIRYQMMMPALSKLGHKVLFSAPRNSPEMHLNLLNNTECTTILHSAEIDVRATIGSAYEGRKSHAIPSLDDLFWSMTEPAKHYSYTKTFEEARNEPYVIFHTSGSTGMPKPVPHTHGWAAAFDYQLHHPPVNGRRSVVSMIADRGRVLKGFAPWHTSGGDAFGLLSGVFGENCFVWFPYDRMPTAEDALKIAGIARCNQVKLSIDQYQAMAKLKGGLEMLESMDAIWYGGGAMDESLGKLLSKRCRMVNLYGGTECGAPGLQLVSDAWNCVNFDSSFPGLEFRDMGDGIYELFVVRYPGCEDQHAVWHVFPDIQEWSLKDLWSKHPTLPNHWAYQGRVDDLIVFKAAYKYNPLAFEEHLRTHPLIRAALMAGTGHNQSVALLELDDSAQFDGTEESKQRILDAIWPTMEEANETAPRHARVLRSHVLFTKPDCPIQKAMKGTVQRAPTLRNYRKEIDDVYERFGDEKLEGIMPAVVDGK
ncbi:acetyl-CoA synthetase-like protein [Rhizodiscina lignyota]|uniref:Acetyl-CoA synthetase-like protein n=1 Tax=Rhizodiscina lignyota TaxID=1504668 RepID=A0A9P4IPZ6_9PEZI|nr:acetyl-CoA synthetase-like protein [Rhizodiscina lignyota]